MTITDEAVEAAAEAAYALRPAVYYLDDSPVPWAELAASGTGKLRKERQLDEARVALEAAASHMLAEAWEAGMAAAKLQAAGIKAARNPYRPAP